MPSVRLQFLINTRQPAVRMQQMNGFTQVVISWGGLTIGAIGTLLAIIAFVRKEKVLKRNQRIEADQLLSQAWDILGSRPGTTWIFGAKNFADRLENARRLIAEALSKTPNYAKAYMYLGVYWQFTGDYRKALECHRKAIKLDNTYSSAYNNLGKTYAQMGDWKAASENYKLALKYDEDFAYARYNLGAALLYGGDATGAIAELEKITQQLHCPAAVHLLLGRAYQIGGSSSRAEEEFQIARDLSSVDKETSHSSP